VANLLLITLQGDKDFVALEEKVVDEIVKKYGGVKVADPIAQHEWDERCYEFRARKAGTGSVPAEVVVPVTSWSDFVDECYEGFKAMRMEAGGIIGVIADRSTAMFMPYYFMDSESIMGMTVYAYNFYMGDRAAEYGGRSLGLGVFFAYNLDRIHDAGSAEFMRLLKTSADPRDVMNPGHLVCGKTRFGINMGDKLMTLMGGIMQGVKKLLPADSAFASGKKRFHFDEMELEKQETRNVKL